VRPWPLRARLTLDNQPMQMPQLKSAPAKTANDALAPRPCSLVELDERHCHWPLDLGHQVGGAVLRRCCRARPALLRAPWADGGSILTKGCYRPAMITARERHRLLMSDRTGDAGWIAAVIADVLAKNRNTDLAEIEGTFRDAAAHSYLIGCQGKFEVAIGMPAMLAAVAAASLSPEANRAALAASF
jgi:hypothetical protein